MSSFSKRIEISASVRQIWDVLSDIVTIAEWNPGVANSYTTSSARRGMNATRHVELLDENQLDEIVVDWKSGQSIKMRVTETGLPFEALDMRYNLAPVSGQTQVSIQVRYEVKYGAFGNLLDKLLIRGKFEENIENMLFGLKEYCEGEKKYDF